MTFWSRPALNSTTENHTF